MPRERWAPFIKDYEGGTLMECYINPRIEYLSTTAMIARQRKAIELKVAELTTNGKVWPGLSWGDGVTAYALDAIPGIKEAGWNCEVCRSSPGVWRCCA
jgi:histone acetyltransferase